MTREHLEDWHRHVADAWLDPDTDQETPMAITPGAPPNEPDMRSETNPPFKHEEQRHTGQAHPTPISNHPLNDEQLNAIINGGQ